MSKRAAVGDAHLSGFQSDTLDKKGLPKRLGFIIKSLDFIVDFCNQKNIFDFDFLGDLVNDKSIIYTVAQDAFKDFLVRRKNCRFRIISGNHDLSSTGDLQKSAISVFSEYPNVKCFVGGPEVIDNITYIPFTEKFLETIKISPPSDILITHLGLNEAHLQSGLSKVDKISIKDLSKFKLALMGHYHRPQDFSNGTTHVWYAGSLTNKDWNDKNEQKRFLIYDTETLEVESVPIDCGIPQFIELTINNETDKIEILKQAEIAKNNGNNVRIKNKSETVIKDEVSGGVLVLEQHDVDITDRGITISMTKEEQLKKYLSIKEIPEVECPEYLSLIAKYDLLHKDE